MRNLEKSTCLTVRLNVVKEVKSTLSGREFQQLITRSLKINCWNSLPDSFCAVRPLTLFSFAQLVIVCWHMHIAPAVRQYCVHLREISVNQSRSAHMFITPTCVNDRLRTTRDSDDFTGCLHVPIVGPTGRSDPGYVRLSVRPVGQTGRTDCSRTALISQNVCFQLMCHVL